MFTSRFGKIQAVAKGGRRTKSKFGASLETFTYSLRSVSAAKKMDKVDTRVNLFLLGLISEAGYRPSLKGCIFCRNPVRHLSGFNIEKSGVVCSECIEASPETSRLSRGSLSFLKASGGFSSDSAADRVTLSSEVNMEIDSLLKNYLRFHTGHTPFKKSKKKRALSGQLFARG